MGSFKPRVRSRVGIVVIIVRLLIFVLEIRFFCSKLAGRNAAHGVSECSQLEPYLFGCWICIWVAVETMVPFWILSIIRHLV